MRFPDSEINVMAKTEYLEKLLASGTDSSLLRFGLGSAYFTAGNNDKAVEHLRCCIAQDDNYTAAFKLLGKALYRQQQWHAAAEVFKRGCCRAAQNGDKQAEKEIRVFIEKIRRRQTKA
ncbi:MAG: hypothetical protein OSB45_03850 [Pseudomonadales bacterium]|nr:hypothetical protein [Pseudomonadales bacterium]|tara:strand:+ start:228 stop:584 length:357 start_codon:yes stop_codon:yes gene_type:complete